MSFCESCGRPLHEGARFCGACGSGVPEEPTSGAPVPERPPEPSSWSCAACASENPPEALFCAQCGTSREATPTEAGKTEELPTAIVAAAAEAPPAAGPSTQGTMEASAEAADAPADGARAKLSQTLRTPWVIALIAVLVVIAIAAGAVLVVVQRSNDQHRQQQQQQAQATFDGQSQAIVTTLAPKVTSVDSSLPGSLRAYTWSTRLGSAIRSARRLHTALVQSQGDCAKLVCQTSPQTSTKQALDGALKALAVYSESVAALPWQLAAVTDEQAQTVHRDAAAARAACEKLQAADPGLAALTVGACATMPAGVTRARSEAELHSFLVKVQNDILNQSQYGRSDIVSAVAGVNGMTMNPDDAATMIESVQSNRQSLLDQLSAMTVPGDSRASNIHNLLQQSLQHSIEADRYYAAWMHRVYDYYYTPSVGYQGHVPHDKNYDNALGQSSQAGSAKSSFVRIYNPLARYFGLRSNWQAGQI